MLTVIDTNEGGEGGREGGKEGGRRRRRRRRRKVKGGSSVAPPETLI